MIKAYNSFPSENGRYMWDVSNSPVGVICQTCKRRVDFQAINPKFRMPGKHFDLSRTYDGSFIVSTAFRDFIRPFGQELRCEPLPTAPGKYFVLFCPEIKVKRTANLHLDELCPSCKEYRSVWGYDPNNFEFKNYDVPIKEGLFVTDLKFGAGWNAGPTLIIGTNTYEKMETQKFKGLFVDALRS